MTLRQTAAALAFGVLAAASVYAQPFSFTTGAPDGRLGALARKASPGKIETETADDFLLDQTTVITHAKVIGLVPAGTPLSDIKDVEVEFYHNFPLDSVTPPSGKVPTRDKSPSDVEIDTATRDASAGTLTFSPAPAGAFHVSTTVVNKLMVAANPPGGEPAFTGDAVEISIVFTSPIVLPAGHYFFRPEILLASGDFLFLSTPKPIVAPGNPFTGDAQAWIRDPNLAPDWLRVGGDIIGGVTPPAFNMAFSLAGETIRTTGTPGQPNCHGKTISGLADQFGNASAAAVTLGFASEQALQDTFKRYCER